MHEWTIPIKKTNRAAENMAWRLRESQPGFLPRLPCQVTSSVRWDQQDSLGTEVSAQWGPGSCSRAVGPSLKWGKDRTSNIMNISCL